MAWSDYSTAPPAGTPVCFASDLEGVQTFEVASDAGRFPLILIRKDGELRGYVNACPHQYLPLDYQGKQLVSACGGKLMCTAHGAQFEIHTGEALAGAPCGLDPVPVTEREGQIFIGS